MHQVEGITTVDGLNYFISNEKFMYQSNVIYQNLHRLDLGSYLSNYLYGGTVFVNNHIKGDISVYPNPATDIIRIKTTEKHMNAAYNLYNISGGLMLKGIINSYNNDIDISVLKAGMYFLHIDTDKIKVLKYD